MKDTIIIRDLLLRTIIGLNDWEREKKQDIILNIVLHTNMKKSGDSDKIEDSVNYKDITKRIINIVENSSYQLLEKLASSIAHEIIYKFDVEKVEITIDKPHALRFSRSVAVQMIREKKDYE
ncbi:MAG: dihydroneopterin aldolase [Pseudomonadota bacterium]|nr:dihydroneopterin aldolase [Pseudomonadota bacterium]